MMNAKGRILSAAIVAVMMSMIPAASAVNVEVVPVGNLANWDDTTGCGAVNYAYNIGKYEVTAGQYTEFLNAVATTDTYGLYNTNMSVSCSWGNGCRIERSDDSGSYTYSVAADWANRPVNNVGWGDAARFANWLHNGQPTGAQDSTTTEDGAYYLNGATSGTDMQAVSREVDWKWAIPTEDEWYKAAYHKNNGDTGDYFDYPTSSDVTPSNSLVDPTDPGNNATFKVGTDDYTLDSPYYRTEVGAHENSDSPYGTFDQGGNVWEWNEAIAYFDLCRGLRGGSYASPCDDLASSAWLNSNPDEEYPNVGFRVASEIPEPCSLGFLLFGGLVLLRTRRG